jgi:hypothetical protein
VGGKKNQKKALTRDLRHSAHIHCIERDGEKNEEVCQ